MIAECNKELDKESFKTAVIKKITVRQCNNKNNKRNWDKKFLCVFCEDWFFKIPHHLESKDKGHTMYKDVSLAIELKPKEQDEEVKKNILEQRSLIFEKLRKRELFNHNIKVLKKGAGELFQRNDHQDQFVHRIFIL